MSYSEQEYSNVQIQPPNTIIVSKRLSWDDTRDTIRRLYDLVVNRHWHKVIIDISRVGRLYPNGIIPLIAEIDRLHEKYSTKFIFRYPMQENAYQFAYSLGWISQFNMLAKNQALHNVKEHTSGIRVFHDEDELNDGINDIIMICAQRLEFASGSYESFEWALNEIAGNVLVHANVTKGWMQVLPNKVEKRIDLVVCDNGVSIPYNIKRAFGNIISDLDALQKAIQKGVTSNPEKGQGNGLAGALAIAQANGGYLRIASGKGAVQVNEGKVKAEKIFPPVLGTVVEMHFSTEKSIDLRKTLWGTTPCSYLEMKYDFDDGEHIDFKLKEYATNFGNRPTGERLRYLILNILKINPGKYILIDMADISVISSSFADEFIAMLVIKFGFVDFISYIRFANMNSLCRDVINIAVQQRIVQIYGAENVTMVGDFE